MVSNFDNVDKTLIGALAVTFGVAAFAAIASVFANDETSNLTEKLENLRLENVMYKAAAEDRETFQFGDTEYLLKEEVGYTGGLISFPVCRLNAYEVVGYDSEQEPNSFSDQVSYSVPISGCE